MDFHPPQGAHTSYLRTLSKIIDLRGFVCLASQDISFKGAAHLTSNFASVNTLKRSFSLLGVRVWPDAVFAVLLFRAIPSKGAHLTSVPVFVNPAAPIFCVALESDPGKDPRPRSTVSASQ